MALLGPPNSAQAFLLLSPLAWALVSCSSSTPGPDLPPWSWAAPAVSVLPGLSLRPVQLFQQGLCVRGGLPQSPDVWIHSRHLCQLRVASAHCLPLAAPMWPMSYPMAAAGGGGWHCYCELQRKLGALLGLAGVEGREGGVSSPHPCSLLELCLLQPASSCHMRLTCLPAPAPLPAPHLHLSPELLAHLLGRAGHPQLPLWSCLLAVPNRAIRP